MSWTLTAQNLWEPLEVILSLSSAALWCPLHFILGYCDATVCTAFKTDRPYFAFAVVFFQFEILVGPFDQNEWSHQYEVQPKKNWQEYRQAGMILADNTMQWRMNIGEERESTRVESVAERQGCISCGILLSGTGARGVSSEHMENMEMFSCSPT